MSVRAAAATVFAITFSVWLAGARGAYHFDDAITPLGDPASQSIGAWASHATTTLRPLAKLTYAIEGSLGVEQPALRRVPAVAVHALAAVLLMLLVMALIDSMSAVIAALLALVWALHPVHAESVLAVAGRPAALAGLLVLGALLAATRERERTAAGLLLCAILCRETALAALLPIVAASWFASRRLNLYALGVAIVSAAWIAWTPRYQQLAAFSYGEMDPVSACTAQLAAVPVGLSLYLRPWALSIDHGEPLPNALAVGGIVVYIVTAALLLIAWRRGARAPMIGIALWLAAIAPTQSIVPKIDWLTERPLSLALAGVVIALAPWCRRWIAPAVLAVAFAVATLWRGQLYADDIKLWADAVEKSPHALRPYWNLGQALIEADRLVEARALLLQAQKLAPYDARIEAALSYIDRKRGRQ